MEILTIKKVTGFLLLFVCLFFLSFYLFLFFVFVFFTIPTCPISCFLNRISKFPSVALWSFLLLIIINMTTLIIYTCNVTVTSNPCCSCEVRIYHTRVSGHIIIKSDISWIFHYIICTLNKDFQNAYLSFLWKFY